MERARGVGLLRVVVTAAEPPAESLHRTLAEGTPGEFRTPSGTLLGRAHDRAEFSYGVVVNDDWNTNRVNRFRIEAASRGLPAEQVEEWIRVALPATFFTQGGEGPLAVQMGGDPLLPNGAPDPCHPLVASVDCALLPPDATSLPLPPEGQLLFFAHPDLDFTGPARDAVRYIPAGTATSRRSTDSRETFESQDMRTMWHHLSPPEPERFAETRWDDPQDAEYKLADELQEAWTHVGGLWPIWTFALGGHPYVINTDPLLRAREEEPTVENADEWVLLATWRCGQEVKELDMGAISWVIRRRDLAARRFDRVYGHVDMW